MSSTNRSGESYIQRKAISDYYVTPIEPIVQFLEAFYRVEPDAFKWGQVLDPCAGGDASHEMSYPVALTRFGVEPARITTLDVRADSPAELCEDYLTWEPAQKFRAVITNPPFLLAEEIIRKAYHDCEYKGFVIMLLRLNFLGGAKRKASLWDRYMPKYIFVHNKRMSFTDDGKTDSVEYMHAVWQRGVKVNCAKLFVI